ncbi:putative serine protease K12H4.7 isoform X1 [Pectinophora gossypiella]|uniref:putative serine protease K12H4.7 isoform X1 n=1 Tax=Pectinophora gossypiella TaxID=13191 RepID=UPI00214E1DF2|nr:putative serine protease K12H4.7 isoform X1 [Pectinophora gossypiella]
MYYFYLIFLLNVRGIFGFGLFSFDHGYRHITKLRTYNATILRNDEYRWIEQRLDHFDPNEKRTWKMRYVENLDYWKPNGPIYVFVGGQYAISDEIPIRYGYLHELQRETNGALIYSEHRYYGESIPLDIHVTDNLKYLSSHQALADLAHLIKTIKSSSTFETSKVVFIGGSYAGNLVAWMKLKYPNLVDVAVASSAPVLAKVDFFEYLEKVSEDYQKLGPSGCLEKITEIFQRYEQLLKTADGIEQLKKEENICGDTDMTKLENKQMFFMVKISIFQMRAQYGTPDVIVDHCHQIMDSSTPYLKRLYDDEPKLFRKYRNCIHYDYNIFINIIKTGSLVPWFYQLCTEFGYFQTTTSAKQPFTNNVPVNFYYNVCTGLFGSEFDEKRVKRGVEYTNNFYGGLSPNVTMVVFVNGDKDPWSRLGIVNDLSSDAPAIVIPKAFNCEDLLMDEPSDSDELIAARKNIKKLVKKWIGFGA